MTRETKHKSNRKWITTIVFTTLASIIVFSVALITYAYFKTRIYVYTNDGSKTYFNMGMELNTFFDEINSTNTTKIPEGTSLGIICTDTQHTDSSNYTTVGDVSYYVYRSSAKWGSPNNPYVISRKAHLSNLYVLQNCGYLEQHIEGATEASIPYFLICNPDGTAVSIDCDGATIEPIGNEKYPFIGYVGGAFTDSTVTIAEKSSTQSVVYNAKIQTEEDVIDIGLFGHIGYIKSGAIDDNNTFSGTVSTVRDLLLYDVTVKVGEPSILDKIASAIANHLFSYRKYKSDGTVEDVQNVTIPHENHHIGILAGHVELATVEYISVYYSDDDISAIDVEYVNPSMVGNFQSISGILGFCYEMNSVQVNGKVTIGGINNEDIQINSSGSGTGGGMASGTGRGYVTAAEVYEMYKDNGKIVKVKDSDGNVLKYGLLVVFYYDGTNASLTLSDSKTTVSLSSDYQSIETTTTYSNFFGGEATYTETWNNFIVHDISTTNKNQEYLYYDKNGVVQYATQDQIEKSGVSLKYAAKAEKDSDGNIESFTYLCTQYERSRIVAGTQITNRFYFYDGVFTFALSDATDTIESTWYDDNPDTITVGIDDASQWTQDLSGLPNSVVAFIKPITSVSDLQSGKQIFIAYKNGDSYNIVTLDGNSSYTSGGGDNAVTTKKTTLSVADSNLTGIIEASLNNGTLSFVPENASTTLTTLKADWEAGKIQVLNLGTTSDLDMTLDELRSHYQVKVSFQSQNPSAGFFEDDATTAISESALNVLIANAKQDSTSKYYSIDSVSKIMSDSSYGESFTFFKLVGSTTVDINHAKTAIDQRNITYYDLNGNLADASAIQSAIEARNNKYLARGTSNNKDDSEIPSTANVQTAIDSINSKYYWLEGVSVTSSAPYMSLTDSTKTVELSDIIIGTYYFNSNESTSLASSATELNNLSTNASAYSDTRQYTFTEFYCFNTRRTTTRIYYEFYKVSGDSMGSVLKNNYTGLGAAQADDRVNSLLGTIITQNGIKYCTYNGVTLPVLYEYNRDYYTDWTRNIWNDYVYDGSGTKVITSGSTLEFTANSTQTFNIIYLNITGSGVNYTLNGVTNSHVCTDVSNSSTKVSTTAKWNDKIIFGIDHDLYTCKLNGTSYSNCILIVRYVLNGTFVQTLTGNGLSYSFYNGSSFVSSSTIVEVSSRTYKINGTARQLYRDGTYLGFYINNFKLDGILLQSLTGNGFAYSVVNGTTCNAVATWNGTYTEWNIGQTITADSIKYKIYRGTDGRLGVRAANQTLDGILLETLTANGNVYSVINGSTNAQVNTLKGSSFTNTNETLKVENKTYEIYRSSDNKLGIRLNNERIDGIMVQTLTGSGVVFSLVNSSGTTSLGSTSRTFEVVTGKTVTVDGVAHQVYKSGDYYCIRLANIKTDGYSVAYVYPGSNTNYKFYNQQGTEIVLSSAPKQINGVTISLSDGTATKPYNIYLCDGYLGIELIHIQTDQSFKYQFWHEGNPSASPYYLRILRRAYSVGSSKFSIICATDARVENTEANRDDFGTTLVPCRSLNNSKDCTVIINGDGTAYLQYTVNGETRYLSYNSTGGYFTTASSQDTTSRLYLFTVEGTHDATAGERVVPLAGTEVATYNADEAVLWPDDVYYSDDSETSTYKATTVGTNYSYSTDPTYHVVTLASLQSQNWINKSGQKITKTDLYKVFSLGKGISQINMVNLWNGNTGTILGQDEYVKAPVGTTGEETFIPTGCVAFKVTTASEDHYVRVIVAVPVTSNYYGKQNTSGSYLNPTTTGGDGLDYSKDYSFCMWKITEAQTGTVTFSPDNCYASFELPRSTPFKEKEDFSGYYSNISGNSYSAYGGEYVKKYVNITMNGNTYRAYLNGDEVLVAYQFRASEVGVYLLGSTQDCRIVYFSADSTASSGKDGVSNYRLGTIDFVYDNSYDGNSATKILTTRDADTTVDGVYDYDNCYYPSLCLLFTDNNNTWVGALSGDSDLDSNNFANINNFAVCVRRSRTSGASNITWYAIGGTQVTGGIVDAAYIQFASYSIDSDALTRDDDRLRVSP